MQIKFITANHNEFLLPKDILEKDPNVLAAFANFEKVNEIELECPHYIFMYIIELFKTGKCDLQLIEKLNYKNELLEWCNLYCLNKFLPYLNGYTYQLNDIPKEYLKIYKEEFHLRKNFDKINGDNILINVYKKYYNESLIPSINDSLFNSDKTFNLQTLWGYKKIKVNTFYYKSYKNDSDLKCIVDKETFEARFHYNSDNLFLNFSKDLWKNIVIAGGYISDCLNPRKRKNSWDREPNINTNDIDIFLYGLTEKECEQKIKLLIKNIYTYFSFLLNARNPTVIWRTKDTISIGLRLTRYKTCIVQIIYSRIYTSISEILLGFDIDASCCAYNGEDVYILPKAEYAFKNCVNIAGIDTTRFSNSYTNRLIKYNNDKGFAIYVPGFRQELMVNLDSLTSLNGFALIYKIYYNKKININYKINENHNQNNYEHIKVPKNSPLSFLENVCIFNQPKNMKKIPFVFINTVHIELQEIDNLCTKIIDFTNIFNMKKRTKCRKKNEKFKLSDDDYDNNDDNDFTKNTYEKFKEIEEISDMNKEDPKEDLIYQFQYNSKDYRNNYYYRKATILKPYLEFKKKNPGEQIIAGDNPLYLTSDELNFFAQAYGNNCCYAKFDISKIE